jgi:hypothetical protein
MVAWSSSVVLGILKKKNQIINDKIKKIDSNYIVSSPFPEAQSTRGFPVIWRQMQRYPNTLVWYFR